MEMMGFAGATYPAYCGLSHTGAALEDPSAVCANGAASARNPGRSLWAKAQNRDQAART
jgi:hypothetical protein